MYLFLESRWKYEWPIYDSMTHRLTHASSSVNRGHFSRAFLCPDMLIQQFLRSCVDTNMGKIGSKVKRTAVGKTYFYWENIQWDYDLSGGYCTMHITKVKKLPPFGKNTFKALIFVYFYTNFTTKSCNGILHAPRII